MAERLRATPGLVLVIVAHGSMPDAASMVRMSMPIVAASDTELVWALTRRAGHWCRVALSGFPAQGCRLVAVSVSPEAYTFVLAYSQ